MDVNQTPIFDRSDNPTGCCPRFKPAGWDNQDLHFSNKLFARATTKSQSYVPIDMAEVFGRAFGAIERAHAYDGDQFIVLSRDLSPSAAEHLFAVREPVADLEMVRLSGDYKTRVFEGPFQNAPQWEAAFRKELEAQGLRAKQIYSFYTTCPQCAETYGKNYVVEVAQTEKVQ